MEAKELRLNNLVYVYNDRLSSVDSIGHNVLWVEILEPEEDESIMKEVSKDVISPILLNEEWLVRFGFKFIKNDYIGYSENIMFNGDYWYNIKNKTIHSSDWLCPLEYLINIPSNEGGAINIAKDIEYVHQLQNLYFALTGEELELK